MFRNEFGSDGLLLPVERDQVGARWARDSELPQHRHHLAPVIGPVIDQMLEGLRERLRLANTVSRVLDRLIDASRAKSLEDGSKRRFMGIPRLSDRREIGEVLGIGQR